MMKHFLCFDNFIKFYATHQYYIAQAVTIPLLEECEDDIHTLEMGTWESSGTPKTSKFNYRGQNTSP